MKTPMLLMLGVVLAAGGSRARADDQELAKAISGAAQSLSANEWREAQTELEKAKSGYDQSQDPELRGRYQFYSARVFHQCADDPRLAAAEREKARLQAIAIYRQYLASNPKSSGALNNLAQLLARDQATRDEALELYAAAIAVNDPRAGAYEINRAKLLSDMGRTDEALRAGLDAAKRDQRNSDAQDFALSMLRKNGDVNAIADYVRQLNAAGRIERAERVAVQEMESTKADRAPLLVALAETLANNTVTEVPKPLADSTIGKMLGRYQGDPDIGKGIQELMQLYKSPGIPDMYVWWRQDFRQHEELTPHSRAQALLTLARALGDRCRRAGPERFPCAEGYYAFAIDFTGNSADPAAFLSLAQIYADTGRQDRLEEIANRYEAKLFQGKGAAYGNQNQAKIYQFHLALGTMYAYLGKWDSGGTAANATFQLEHARQVAAELNREAPPDKQLAIPVATAELLADNYAKKGDATRSAQVRVASAEAAVNSGDPDAAEGLVKAAKTSLPANADPLLRARIATVESRIRQARH